MNERMMQFRVGVLVLATFLITVILVLQFNEIGDLVPALVPGGKYTVNVRFLQAPNVRENTPVRKSGILVGRVSDIELSDGGVLVTARIDGNRQIRHNEVFRVVSELLGDAVVDVVPSDDPGLPDTPIKDGETVDGVAIPSPTQIIQNLDARLAQVIDSVTNAGDALAVASGDLSSAARMVTDVLKENRENLESALSQADKTLASVEKVANSANNLIGDSEMQEKLKSAMGQLPDVLKNAHETTILVNRILGDLETMTGPLAKNSEQRVERIDRTIYQLESLITAMASFSQKLNQRQGSLGLLVHDRELYDHLNRAAKNIDELTRRLKPIVEDVRIISDNMARHPGSIIRDAIRPRPGIK